MSVIEVNMDDHLLSGRIGLSTDISEPVYVLKNKNELLVYKNRICYFRSMFDAYRYLVFCNDKRFLDYLPTKCEFTEEKTSVVDMSDIVYYMDECMYHKVEKDMESEVREYLGLGVTILCKYVEDEKEGQIPYLVTYGMDTYEQTELELVVPYLSPMRSFHIMKMIIENSICDQSFYMVNGVKVNDKEGDPILSLYAINGKRRVLFHDYRNIPPYDEKCMEEFKIQMIDTPE